MADIVFNPVFYDEHEKLVHLLASGKVQGTIDYAAPPMAAIGPQVYVIQWEDVIQSFDTGIIAAIGTFILQDKDKKRDSVLSGLNHSVMDGFNFKNIWDRKRNLDIFDEIRERHAEAGSPLDTATVSEIRQYVLDKIKKDEMGLIFMVSPFLAFLKTFVRLFEQGQIKKAIIAYDEFLAETCEEMPFKILRPFFKKDDNQPIYLHPRKESFYEYHERFMEENPIDHLVTVTSDPKVISGSADKKYKTHQYFIFPDYPLYKLSPDLCAAMTNLRRDNAEYVCYEQKPCTI